MPSVTAVVVNYNAGHALTRALEALCGQDVALTEIVVVDSGSTDGSLEAARSAAPQVRYIELGQNFGPCRARNRGMAEAASEFILLVDDDVYLESDCLELLLAHVMSRREVAAVTPRILLYPQTDVIQLDGAGAHFIGTMVLHNSRAPRDGTSLRARSVGAFSTSCVLLRRAAVLEAGGFDESFFIYLEDLEFGLRLRALGHVLVCEPRAVAVHDRGKGTANLSFRDSGAYSSQRAFLTMRNRWQVAWIYYRARSLLLVMPALLLYEAATLAFALARGVPAAWVRSWAWQATHAGHVVQRRRFVQARRRVSDRDLFSAGTLPMAPGLVEGPAARIAVGVLSGILDRYWRLVRPLLGRVPRPSGPDHQRSSDKD